MKKELVEKAYEIAKERYAAIGVDTDAALETLQNVQLSLHCWQADDVSGFEDAALSQHHLLGFEIAQLEIHHLH